ncbi:helix-turn-helix domain-containing protein [Thomasclavelia sp.]|uniref:helix-turn-helix domain-containing protein n=1 Tax=Thomasclavelia sp. TaxID=3025757 RepID=UPI0025F69E19|nr:helix-turn-helix domain-containing protein [Thomasclavelia sp.]
MKITLSRHLSILYYFIVIAPKATSKQLAQFTSTSVRSIKSDIAIINELLSEDGVCFIVANQAKGYEFKILDKEKYIDFSSKVRSEYSFFKNTNVEKMKRRLYITQRILSSKHVLVDDLADELYLTRFAIKDDLVWVTNFFKTYDLNLFSKANKGLSYQGDEYDIRFIMIETFCSQYHDLPDIYSIVAFDTMFYQDFNYYQDIRHQFLKIIRDSAYIAKDINTKKLATYIVLTKNRIKQGYTIIFDEQLKNLMRGQYEYQIAKKVFEIKGLYDDLEIGEDELCAFTKALVVYRDVDLMVTEDMATVNFEYVSEARKIYNQIFTDDLDGIGNSLYRKELFLRYQSDFVSSIYEIYMLNEFDSNYKYRLSTYYEIADYEFSPLAIEMTREVLLKIGEILKTHFNDVTANRFILLFELILKKVNYKYHKKRIAILSLGGRVITRNYREMILEKFDRYVEYMDVFNQYEMRKINFSDYDIGLGDSDSIFNYYPIDILNCNLLKIDDSTINLFEKVFSSGYDRSQVEKLIKITNIDDNFECNSYLQLFKLISYKFSNEPIRLEKILLDSEKVYSYLNIQSSTALIMCDYRVTKKEFVEIYSSNNKMYWDKEKSVKYIIVLSINNNTNITDLKVINKIMQVLFHRPEKLESLMENIETTYNDIFNKIIKDSFIRR